jgi:hypothetical protein
MRDDAYSIEVERAAGMKVFADRALLVAIMRQAFDGRTDVPIGDIVSAEELNARVAAAVEAAQRTIDALVPGDAPDHVRPLQ